MLLALPGAVLDIRGEQHSNILESHGNRVSLRVYAEIRAQYRAKKILYDPITCLVLTPHASAELEYRKQFQHWQCANYLHPCQDVGGSARGFNPTALIDSRDSIAAQPKRCRRPTTLAIRHEIRAEMVDY